MKKMCEWFFMNVPAKGDQTSSAISFLRIFAGLIMLPYGWGKIVKYDSLSVNFFNDPIGIGDIPSLWLTIFAQIICAVLLIVGFQSRFAAFVLFINMAVATKVHFIDPFCPILSLPVVYMGLYAFLTITGGGKLSLDAIIFKKEAHDPICADCRPNIPSFTRFAYMLAGFICSYLVFSHILTGIAMILVLILSFSFFMSAIYGYCPVAAMMSKRK